MAKDLIYEKIEAYLKGSIEGGSLKAGDAIYSESLLCEKFKASRTSVRKAIRRMVEENLLVSHQGKGTFVKSTGHGIIHNAVCLVNHWSRAMRDFGFDSYLKDVILGTERAVNERGAACLIYSGVVNSAEEIASKMAHIKVDGLAIDGRYQDFLPDLEAFKSVSPHIVLLDGNPAESSLSMAAPDAEAAFLSILELVLEKRKGERIGFLFQDMNSPYRFRLEGFKAACAKLGVEGVDFLNYGEGLAFDSFSNVDHYPLVRKVVERWARSLPSASGTLVCSCDYSAAKAIKAFESLGFNVPRDFGVTGFCGIGFGELVSPALTTAKVDSALIGETAVKLLFEMIVEKAPRRKALLPAKLLKRDSL